MLDKESFFPLGFADFLSHFSLQSLFSQLVLSDELANSHHFVELQVFGCHELRPHNPVKHLVEVDEPIVDIDAHLQHDSVDDCILCLVWNLHLLLHASRQLLEKLRDLLRLDLSALISLCEHLPSLLEVLKVFFEARQRVVVLEVILGELLDDDQDKQVEHNVGH